MWTVVYSVRGDSMAPSLQMSDKLLAGRRPFATYHPRRGDLVVVRDPRTDARRYVKRVVGLPGEQVRLSQGLLLVDDEPLHEPYLGGLPASLGLDELVWGLQHAQYFVMGDNRAHSTDSREFGPVGRDHIESRVWFRIWPLSGLGRL